jgi:putative heme degradation protein
MVWYGRYGMIWYGIGMVWYGMVWYGMDGMAKTLKILNTVIGVRLFLGTWHSEYILCLDYINILLEEEPLKKFGFALINRYVKPEYSLHACKKLVLDLNDATRLDAREECWS